MKFRVRFSPSGQFHVSCRVFGEDGALNGNLTFARGNEFREFIEAFDGADFIPDNNNFGLIEAIKEGEALQ